MKTKILHGIICLTIFFLFTGQASAAGWKLFYSSGSGEMFYDENSVKKVNKNIVHVLVKKTYSEQGKLEKFSLLKKSGKGPINPYILSHELIMLEIDCVKEKMKISSDKVCDKRGQLVTWDRSSSGRWNDIVRKSSEEKLKNIVCGGNKTPGTKNK
jgi:hypothetical protein